jgi:DNA-binding phage protein
MIIRKRRYREDVLTRDAKGKPLTTRARLIADFNDTPESILRLLQGILEEDGFDKIPHVRAKVLVEATVALILHHNVADLAKASGVTQKTLREACVHGWKGTYEVMWAVWYAFGYELGATITPIKPIVKKATRKAKAAVPHGRY